MASHENLWLQLLLILKVINGNDTLIMMHAYLKSIPERAPLMMSNAFLVRYTIWWENTSQWSSIEGRHVQSLLNDSSFTTTPRFYEGPMPDFSQFQQPKRNPKHQHVWRREQPSSLITGCALLATPRACSIKMTYHNVPLELPPPPGSVQQHYQNIHMHNNIMNCRHY